MLEISLNNSDIRLEAALQLKNERLIKACLDKMSYMMQRLQAKIVTEKLAGQVLTTRSGALARSVRNPRAELEGTSIVGKLDWGGSEAPYAPVHEFGGIKSVYAINPRYTRAQSRRLGKGTLSPFKWLRFEVGGEIRFARAVFHKRMPKRSFMLSAVDEMRKPIVMALREALMGAVKGK